jgi:ketosteroid isomerase-like protein
MGTEQIVNQYARAQINKDLASMRELAHPDIVVTYPQSGEVIRGIDNYIDMLANYPGGLGQLEEFAVHGTKERVSVIASPFGLPTITVTGSGDTFFMETTAEYQGGETFKLIGILVVRDGRVAAETSYFAAEFDAPDWRLPYVE